MRPLRILYDGATYHVTSKIDHDNPSLHDHHFKSLFLDFMKTAKQKFSFELWNFCIMDNHIHFLIKPGPGVSLSKIMQWIKCNFAKKWNRENSTKGHLWGERFFSRIIRNIEDFQAVSRYIDENPVKAKMVENANDWKFGGLFHRLKGLTGIIDYLIKPENLFGENIPMVPG
jgi:putative transposase